MSRLDKFIKDLNEFLLVDWITDETTPDELEQLFATKWERERDMERNIKFTEDTKEDYFNEQNNYPTRIGNV